MINLEIIYDLAKLAVISGAIATLFVQKIKCNAWLTNECINVVVSFITSMAIGIFFTMTFSTFNTMYAVWVGIFTFVEAEAVFKVIKTVFKIKTFQDYVNEVDPTTTDEEEPSTTEGEG